MKRFLSFFCLFVTLSLGITTSLIAQNSYWRARFQSVGYNVAINPYNPNTIYAEDRTGVLNVSHDKGKTWTQLTPVPGPFRGMRNIFIHPNDTLTMFILRDLGGMWKTVNGGQSWYQVIANYGIDGESIDYDKQHPDTMYAGNYGDGTVYRSTNRGETWTAQYTSGDWLCGVVVRPDSGNVILVGSGGGTISKSNDAGVHWTQVFNAHTSEVPKIVFNPVHPLIGYANVFSDNPPETNCGLIKTTDGGSTWFYAAILKDTALWSLVIDPVHPETLYTGRFSSSGYGIDRTTDGGMTYQHFQNGIKIDLSGGYSGFVSWNLKLNPLAPNDVWLAGSTNSFGSNWPGMIYHYVGASTTTIQGTVRDGVNSTPLSATITTTENLDSLNVSGSYALNYFTDDPTLSPTVHLRSAQHFPKDTTLTFVLNNTQNLDIYLTPLPGNSINGTVFNDLNGNRVKDIGEPGLSGWRVRAYGPSNDSIYTDVNGMYSMTSLTSGTYTVSESLETGWVQTIPLSLPSCLGAYTVAVSPGNSQDKIDFGVQGIAPGATLMFQDFTTTTFPPPCWGVVNSNGNFTWLRDVSVVHSTPGSAKDGTGSIASGKANDWLYFGPITLKHNKIYRLSWWDRTFINASPQGIDSLDVTVGFSPPVSSSQIINSRAFNTNTAFEYVQQDFSVNTDSLYYIAFHDYSAAGNTIRVDDVMLQYLNDVLPVDLSLGSLTPSVPPLIISPKTKFIFPSNEQPELQADQLDMKSTGNIALERWTRKGAISTTAVHQVSIPLNHSSKTTTVYNDSVDVLVGNLGQSSVSYSINWNVSGSSQTPYSGGPVNSQQSQSARLHYSTSVLGSHNISATVSAIGDGNGANNTTTGHSRVYPGGIVSLLYDDGNTNPSKGDVGFGNASSFTAAVRFTPAQTLQLTQVDAFINNMGSSDSLLVRVWGKGADNNTPGALLYSEKLGGSDYVASSSSGEYMSLPLVNAPSMYNGSDFWVSITYTGLPYPQGADFSGDQSRSLYSGDAGNTLNWKPAYSAWLIRAIGTGIAPGTASISGLKFNDLNANGVNNSEPVLQGWTIQLTGTVNGTTQTDINGQYSFTSLPAGIYTVSETQQTGWTQTTSPASYNIPLSSGQNSTGNDFGNFQYVISGTKYNDVENDSLVTGNNAIDGWVIKLYKGGILQARTVTSGGGHYSFTGIAADTYTVEESLQVGWIQTVPRIGDPGVTLSTFGPGAGPRAYIVTVGAAVLDSGFNFGNFHPNSITVRKFVDNDGDFTTTGDRTLKSWHLELHKSAADGPLVASNDGDSLTVPGLIDGLYFGVEADSSGWVHLGIMDPGPTYTSMNSWNVLVTDGQNKTLDFINAAPAFGQMYRTGKYEDWANALDQSLKRKAVRRKANKVEFKFNIVAPKNSQGFTLKFSMLTDARLSTGKAKADTLLSWTGQSSVQYTAAIDSGDTFQVEGIGAKGMKLRTSVAWTVGTKTITVRIPDTGYKLNAPRLPLPNLHNVGEELFPKGFGQGLGVAFPTGMIVGVPQGINGAHSVIHKKYADVMKTLVKVSSFGVRYHGLDPRCLDFYNGVSGNGHLIDRQQEGLSPDKHNNKLLGELTALKLNVAASAFNKFPNGLGELTFNDNSQPGNLLNGQTIDTIISKADLVISCLLDTTKGGDTLTPAEVYDVIRSIDSAFSSNVIDTNSFAAKTSLTGVRRLIDVPFLHPTPGIAPVNHIAPEVVGDMTPVSYMLHQNYPNPFNPSTKIRFELPNPAIITMKVYNLLGQEVATLKDHEMMEEGWTEIAFDAGNLSSGVYFYRLVAQPVTDEDGNLSGTPFTSVKKMLLIK